MAASTETRWPPAAAQGALAVFAVCFVLAYIACSLCAGSLEFWHVWGWFGYA